MHGPRSSRLCNVPPSTGTPTSTPLSGAANGGIASHVVSVWQQHQCHIDLADTPLSAQLANKSQFTRLAARSWCYDLAERTEARLSFNRDARMHRIDGQYRLRSHRPQ